MALNDAARPPDGTRPAERHPHAGLAVASRSAARPSSASGPIAVPNTRTANTIASPMTTSTATTVNADGAAPGATNPSSAPATQVASAAMRPMADDDDDQETAEEAGAASTARPAAAMPAAPAATPVPCPRRPLAAAPGPARVVAVRLLRHVVAQASSSASA